MFGDGGTLKGIPVALQFGYKEAWDGAETSLGTFSDPVNKIQPKKNFRFPM